MACLLFLRELRQGTIKELYTDYPIGSGQLSLDIMLHAINGDSTKERIYEVKTGEYFKDDSKSKKSSEVRDVLLTFLEYKKISPDFEGVICFSKGLKNGIAGYLGPADRLYRNSRLDPETRQAAKVLVEKLVIKDLATQSAMHQFFFGKVQFDQELYKNDQTWTTFDEQIGAEITGIAETLDVHDHVHILPNSFLVSRLIAVIQKHAGTGNDIAKELVTEVMKFMALRRELEQHEVTGVASQRKAQARTYIAQEMINNFKVEDLLPEGSVSTPPITATDTGTGGIIQ
jgi:hypothetical protein